MMTTMTIRNIDAQLEAQLRVQAAMHDHSIEDEARDILRAALSATPERGLLEAIRARMEPLGGVELELPVRDPIRIAPDLGA